MPAGALVYVGESKGVVAVTYRWRVVGDGLLSWLMSREELACVVGLAVGPTMV